MATKRKPVQLIELDYKVLAYFVEAAEKKGSTPRAYLIGRRLGKETAEIQLSTRRLVMAKLIAFDRRRNCTILETGESTVNTHAREPQDFGESSSLPDDADDAFAVALAGRLFEDDPRAAGHGRGFATYSRPATYVPRSEDSYDI